MGMNGSLAFPLTCAHQARLENDPKAHITPSLWCLLCELVSFSSPTLRPKYAPHIRGFVALLPGAWSRSSVVCASQQVVRGFSELSVAVWIPRGQSFPRSSRLGHFGSSLYDELRCTCATQYRARAQSAVGAREVRGEERGARATDTATPTHLNTIQERLDCCFLISWLVFVKTHRA